MSNSHDEPQRDPAAGDKAGPSSEPLRAHAAHTKFQKSIVSRATGDAAPPGDADGVPPVILEKLEALDDAVFEAMAGQSEALEKLRTLWPAVLGQMGEVGPELVAESCEQYLHYALRIWEDCLDGRGLRDPARAISALEVLCVLFDEA
ncbi:MAG: hypothetical protein ABSG68_25690 [Thermoguttaceae bacterium]|jgi:hypothetical protein